MKRTLPGPAGSINTAITSPVTVLNANINDLEPLNSTEANRETADRRSQIYNAFRKLFKEVIDNSEDESLDQLCQQGHFATVTDVFEGLHDLRVNKMILLIEDMKVNVDGTITFYLQDWTGRITGYMVPEEIMKLQQLDMHLSARLSPGNFLYLQKVSIYVARSPFQRLLNITCQSITAVLPNVAA